MLRVLTGNLLSFEKNGGILTDNPGMREVGIADAPGGLKVTFDKIISLAQDCKFKEIVPIPVKIGCAVLEALDHGDIDMDSYDNYLKIEREKTHFESTVAERRKKDKAFGKMVKKHEKDIGKIADRRWYG